MPPRKHLAAAGVILLVTLVVYIPAMRGGFVWNDEEVGSLTKNIVLEDNGLYRVWFTTESVNYWPVIWTSYWLEYQFWGLNPIGYHIVNVLLHAICALLIWRILLRLNIPGAWLAALVFAIHPVNVESVAWITQRKNILSLLFFMVALLWYLRFADGRRRAWYWAAVASFLLAMLSKGAAVTLPVVLLICTWWRHGTITRRDVLRSLPFFAVALLMSGVEVWFQYARAIGEDVVRDDTFPARLAGAGWTVWFYLYKAVLPIGLSFIYPRWEIDPANWLSYLPNLALLVLLGLCWRYRRGWGRPVLFALGFYVVTLGPVLGFLNIYFMRYSFVADHYQYLSIIGIIALVVGTVGTILKRLQPEGVWPARALATLAVVVLGLLTWQQAGIYKNSETLWRDTLRKNPDAWMAHSNLGNLLASRHKLDEAISHYHQALRRAPDNNEVHNNMGSALALQGKTNEAIRHYRQALRIKPDYADAHNNLGLALLSLGKPGEAIGYFRQAVKITPEFARAHLNLGNALIARQRPDEAIDSYRQALELDPTCPTTHYNLGATLALQGKSDEAIDHFRQALLLKPDYPEAHYNLGLMLVGTDRLDEALTHFQTATRLKPDWPAPLKKHAWFLATHPVPNVHRASEAIRLAERAAELTKHQDAGILDTLAAAYAAAGQFDRAVKTAEAALASARTTPNSRLTQEIRARLELYRQMKPYREPAQEQGEVRP